MLRSGNFRPHRLGSHHSPRDSPANESSAKRWSCARGRVQSIVLSTPVPPSGLITYTLHLKAYTLHLLPILPGVDDLLDGLGEADSDVPTWIVLTHLAKVAVVADVIADSILVDIGVLLWIAGE